MPSITAFVPTPVAPDPTVEANNQIGQVITRWLRVSTRLTKTLSGADLSVYLDSLSEEQATELRALWPLIQQIDAILDIPADIADLPVSE